MPGSVTMEMTLMFVQDPDSEIIHVLGSVEGRVLGVICEQVQANGRAWAGFDFGALSDDDLDTLLCPLCFSGNGQPS